MTVAHTKTRQHRTSGRNDVVWCGVVWCGGGGADAVLMTRVYPYAIAVKWVAEHLGVRLPASPATWASTSGWTEAEKMF